MARQALPSEKVPETIYHYTDLNGLRGIIKSGTIYFSAIHILNDASEVSYMWDLLHENKISIYTLRYFFYGIMIYETEEQVKALKKLFLHFWKFYQDKRNKDVYELIQKIGK
ncbi:MAG: hypothetical protein J6O04_05760 [Selenomonadaceae bacterium]|nr:hypothetical protein [Selenomonadaceae bacterium]